MVNENDKNLYGKKLCILHGPASSVSGYGFHFRDIIRSVIKKFPKWDIQILDVRWGDTPRNYLKKNRDDDIIDRLVTKSLKRRPDVYIPVLIPNEFKPIGKYNIGITAGIETTHASPEFIEGLNRMDLNIVPSNHAKEVFERTNFINKDEKTGVVINSLRNEKPIEVLFEGVDTKAFHYIKETEEFSEKVNEIMNDIKEDFAFLFVGHWIKGSLGHDRKDVGMLIKVFCETFKRVVDKPALILKTSGANFSIKDKENIINKIKAIRNEKDMPSIYLIHGDLTNGEMNCLYNHNKIKSFVTFTHGEGYGRPLAEFALSKKPVIAPNWSGHIDFLNENYSILLEGELKDVHKSVIQKDIIIEESKWFYVNYFQASQKLLDVYRNYSDYKNKAREQASIIWNKFNLNKMADELEKIFEKYIPEIPEEIELKLPNFNLPKLEIDDEDNNDDDKIKLQKED